MPIPEKIKTSFSALDMPDYLDDTNLEVLEQLRMDQLELERLKTIGKYNEKYHFKFSDLKSGRNIEDLRREGERLGLGLELR
jgi:hypothetical protein